MSPPDSNAGQAQSPPQNEQCLNILDDKCIYHHCAQFLTNFKTLSNKKLNQTLTVVSVKALWGIMYQKWELLLFITIQNVSNCKICSCLYYERIPSLNNKTCCTLCKRLKIIVLYHIYGSIVYSNNNNWMLIVILPSLYNMNAVCNMLGLTIISVLSNRTAMKFTISYSIVNWSIHWHSLIQ
jgi:hypothetical protein